MKTRIISCLLTSFLFFAGINLTFSQSAEQLYQKGLMQEEGEGNLEEAIKIFAGIVENQNADKSIQAKALLHVGLCYEKLGKDEATKAYQKLVNNFPGQKNEVAIARERLSRLILAVEEISKTPYVPKFTKIKIPTKLSWSVALSPDGKDLALVSDKKLWKMPLSGNLGTDFPGTPVQLNTDGIEVEWSGLSWSRDGKWIAFNDYPKLDDKGIVIANQSIYVVSSNGGKPKKVIENIRSARVVNYRISLSSEGKKLAFSSIEDNKQHIFSTLVDNVIPRQLAEMEAREPVFSPDGKNIAFVKDKNKGIGEGDLGLWVMDADGGKPYKLADAGKASSPIWSPDGKLIAFVDYSVGNQISIVPFSKTENTNGKVIRIDAPAGTEEVRLLAGWTPDNKIGVLLVSKLEFGLFTLPANGGQAAMILTDNRVSQPRFSRDGSQIYYVATPEEGVNKSYRMFLATVPAKGGKGKPLFTNNKRGNFNQFSYQGGNRVSPDGKWIVSSTWTSADTNTVKVHWPTSKIWKVSVDGEAAIQITNTPGNFSDMSPSWSPDGKKVAFIRFQLVADENEFFGELTRIYTVSSLGGEPELLDSIFGKYINSLVWSPDGNKIAFISKEKVTPNKKALNIIDLNTGVSKAIGEIPSVNVHIELAWSPDSKRIAFNDGDGKVIKIMNLSDGSIEDIETGLVDENIYHLDWSPDGKRFVFGGFKGGQAEFRFLEDFLPLDKLAQKKETEDMLVRKVLADAPSEPLGAPSPDGRYISFVDWSSNSNLSILDLETKKRQSLTNFKDPNEQAYYSSWSPNGEQIAYFWWEYDKDQYNLSIVDFKNSKSRVLLKSENADWIELGNWSSDGKYIVATLSLRGKSVSQVIRISTIDGSIQILKTFEKSYLVTKPWISPDGRYVACDLPDDKASGNSDIHILSIEEKSENALFKHPAHDYMLGWTPDGKYILFASDRTGTVDAMIIPVEEGKSIGQPKLVQSNIGPIVPMGFTQKGSFFYGQWPGKRDVFTTEIDFEKGVVLTQPTLAIKRFEGKNGTPSYSNDGKYLAYISRRGVIKKGIPGIILCIRELETGKEFEIIPPNEIAGSISYPTWSPDDSSIALMCRKGKQDIYSYNIQTREFTALITDTNESSSDMDYVFPQWSGDGKILYYFQISQSSQTSQIMARNLATGIDKELFQYSSNDFHDRLFNISLSPDGKWLAAINRSENRVLKVLSTEGGISRDLYSFKWAGEYGCPQIWSKDGKYIIFPYNTDESKWNLMRIPLEGGENLTIEMNILGISSPSLHPDGRHLSFSSAGYSLHENNIWEMENFLPKDDLSVNKNE